MTKKIIQIIFLLSVQLVVAFGQTRVYPADITIVSEIDGHPIEGAIVKIVNSDVRSDWTGDKKTNQAGIAEFTEVPAGKVTIIATCDGFIPIEEKEKITENGNMWTYKLRKMPDRKLYLSGKVTNLSGEPLEGCQVDLKTVEKNMSALTGKNGRFEFVLDEPSSQSRFLLDFQKSGFKLETREGEFLQKVMWIKDVKLEKKTTRKSISPSRFRLGALGEVNFFLSDMKDNEILNAPSGGLLGLYQLEWAEQKLHIGFGWHRTLIIQTTNSYTTLNGFKSDIDTKYNVSSLGFATLRYYLLLSDEGSQRRFSPFVGLTALFVNQKPEVAIFADGNFNEERTSFLKTVPRLSTGISWHLGLVNIEPFLAYSFFRLKSQNFEFNYFGRANPVVVRNNVHQLSFGITCMFALPKL